MLCGHTYTLVQKLWREIGAVRPDDRVQLRMQADALKCLDPAQRLEDRAIELFAQVHFAGKAIAETEPDHVVPNVSSLDDANHTLPPGYSSGAMGFSG